jgi:hypothetical protein
MSARQIRGGVGSSSQRQHDVANGRAQLQHQRRIHHILAGRAPVHMSGRRSVDRGHATRQLLHERDQDVAGADSVFDQRVQVVQVGARGGTNRRHARLRDHSHLG